MGKCYLSYVFLKEFINHTAKQPFCPKGTERNNGAAENYAIRSVNSKVSMVNALLESMGCRDF